VIEGFLTRPGRAVWLLVAPAAAALVVSFAAVAQRPSVDALIARHLQARGGSARWRAVTTLRLTGRVMSDGHEQGLLILARRPGLRREELAFELGTVVSAFDGERAWTLDPFLGPGAARELTGPALELAREQADFDGPLIDHAAKGHRLTLEGETTVDERRGWRVKLTRRDGRVSWHDLDAASGVELRMSVEIRGGGDPVVVETIFDDYRPVDGILVPHRVVTRTGDRATSEIVIEQVAFNVPIDLAVFRMPGR